MLIKYRGEPGRHHVDRMWSPTMPMRYFSPIRMNSIGHGQEVDDGGSDNCSRTEVASRQLLVVGVPLFSFSRCGDFDRHPDVKVAGMWKRRYHASHRGWECQREPMWAAAKPYMR
jgi:hypothetical protein